MLVAGKHSVRHAVILHQLFPAEAETALLLESGLEQIDHAWGFQAHRNVYAVREMKLALEIRA